MKILFFFFSALIGYLFGSLSFALIIGKIFYKKDVRQYGSKSAGATNVLRTLGKKAAAAVAVGDVLKAVIAYLLVAPLGKLSGIGETLSIVSGIFAVLGHNYPLYFNFKGGKGILTSIAFSFMIDYRAALITLIFALSIMAITKYVSLGSILGCILNSILIRFFVPGEYLKIYAIIFLTVLAIYRHRANIKRLIKGEESKLGQKEKKQ